MTYGTPNSRIRTVKVSPSAEIRSGPATTEPTDPDPSIRECWRGSARIANTTDGGAATVIVPETACPLTA